MPPSHKGGARIRQWVCGRGGGIGRVLLPIFSHWLLPRWHVGGQSSPRYLPLTLSSHVALVLSGF